MMSNDPDDIPSGKPAGPGRKQLALRAILWLGGIVVAALGIALTNALVPQFGRGINQITQSGRCRERRRRFHLADRFLSCVPVRVQRWTGWNLE